MVTESELVEAIFNTNQELFIVKNKIKEIKSQLSKTQTILGKLDFDKSILIEELRVYKNSKYIHEITERDIEIVDFRDRLPDVLKRLELK